MEPDVDPGREREERRRRVSRTKKVGAFAVAAAIGMAACSGPGGTARGENGTTTGPGESPEKTAEGVATSFFEAYGAFDVEQAIAYLSDDADISGLMTSVGAEGVEGTLEEFRLLISLLEAQGYKQMLSSCEDLGSLASGTSFRCSFDFHLFGSEKIGLGPFSEGTFILTVRDGEIVRGAKNFAIAEFSPQMWEPFAGWVSTAYPDDAALMYEDETYGGARLTEESIRLWERHIRGYVKDVRLGTEGAE